MEGVKSLAEKPANCQKYCFGMVPYSMMATSKSYQAKYKRTNEDKDNQKYNVF